VDPRIDNEKKRRKTAVTQSGMALLEENQALRLRLKSSALSVTASFASLAGLL